MVLLSFNRPRSGDRWRGIQLCHCCLCEALGSGSGHLELLIVGGSPLIFGRNEWSWKIGWYLRLHMIILCDFRGFWSSDIIADPSSIGIKIKALGIPVLENGWDLDGTAYLKGPKGRVLCWHIGHISHLQLELMFQGFLMKHHRNSWKLHTHIYIYMYLCIG